MWIMTHFDGKVKPYEDLSVIQDFKLQILGL